MTRKLLLFDIDGTLLLSAGAGRRAILAAIREYVSDLEPMRGIRFDGKTDPQIVTELFEAGGDPEPDEPVRMTRVLERYVSLLEHELTGSDHGAAPMPGVPALLERLGRSGAVLGLLTGNVVPGARLKLRAARIDWEQFVVGAYGSDHARRAELPIIAARRAEPWFGRIPDGPDVVIIGDTPADVACAASIGARTVAVATGGYTQAELAETGADAVLPDLSDLARACDAILGAANP
jgi:phosphoglycolate phosphatase-like HAD superfamily hydrolase